MEPYTQFPASQAPLPEPPVPKRSRTKLVLGLVIGLLVAAGVAAIVSIDQTNTTNKGAATGNDVVIDSTREVELAHNSCRPDPMYTTLGDNGSTITIDGPLASYAIEYSDVECVFNRLDAPDYVISHFGSTRQADGTQSDEWGGCRATWNYSGVNDEMNLTIHCED